MSKKDKGKQKAEKILKRIQKTDVNKRGAIFKSEDAKLDLGPLQVSQDFVFSGTDNGIVKMSEAVPVLLERYVYHLKLHNRFAALIEQTEPEFQPLSEAKTVSAEDVDFASRNFHYRHELALMKRNSPQVAEAETALSRQNFTTVKNEEDIWNAYRCLQDNNNVVRSFYLNTKMKKGDMRREMFMKKSKDRICARERLWLNLR
ncbi:hypothetical protein EDC96DRAFT_68328 [Choanephora cucurbitarum]|nr:hypothetical protein EDC96DRAFT_68328 [Choanephora cucurbitarum]